MRIRPVAKILLPAGSILLSFLAIEATLRVWGRVPIPPEHIESARPDLYQEFKPHGYRLSPSRTMTYEYPLTNPRQLTVHSNRHGFRGQREFDEPDARPRVLVLGDSMVFGEGVEEVERFTDRLEALEPRWRVDNLGMTGFGPDLMLRALEQVGLQLHPDIVVLTMYTDDFRRVRPEYAGAGFEIPRYVVQEKQLVSVDYPRAGVWTRWHTVSAAREALWRTSGTEWILNAAILDRVREHAGRSGFDLVLMFLPGTSDTPKDRERRSWLRAYAERTGTRYLDLTDTLLAGERQPLFIRDNWHLNARGHEVVGRTLGDFLNSPDVKTTSR
jgi:GDSL-like Lipase/Acylhydrolase family